MTIVKVEAGCTMLELFIRGNKKSIKKIRASYNTAYHYCYKCINYYQCNKECLKFESHEEIKKKVLNSDIKITPIEEKMLTRYEAFRV